MRFLTRGTVSAPALQPFLKRGEAFARLLAQQQAFDADILIQIGPMNALTQCNQTTVIPFRSRTV
jgi:hypothetical protein